MNDGTVLPKNPTPADTAAIFASWLEEFATAVRKRSQPELEKVLTDDVTWRDFMAFKWDFSHRIGRDAVTKGLLDDADEHNANSFVVSTGQAPIVLSAGGIGGWFDFTTDDRVDRGYAWLVEQDGTFVATALQTQADGLSDSPERTFHNRAEGKAYREVMGRTRWSEDRAREVAFEEGDPTVLVLGAGHNGLSVAARLNALGVSTLVFDREARVGDTWRKRYAALALHSTVWGDHLPYLPLPPTWTSHTPRDKFADFLESYATLLDINLWMSTTFLSGHYDDDNERWDIRLRLADGSIRVMHPRHFVVAGGLFGSPKIPTIEGIEKFEGLAVHSDAFHRGEDFAGQRALVVGSGVSGHEIAQDLYEQGAETTLVQRSSTYVVNWETYHKYWSGEFYEGSPISPDYADQITNLLPWSKSDDINKRLVQQAKEDDQDLLDRLEARGFKLQWGPDGTGIYGQHMSGRDGYHINIGAADLVADGKIGLKQGVEIAEIKNGKTLVFTDGTEAEYDVIIFATGYEQMWGHMRPTLGRAAEKIDKAFGRAADGEYLNTWRRSEQPGLWFATGFIRMARFYSKFTSMLIKSIEDGIEPRDPSK
jgi:putative flavoprotein involved in K+ transport